MLASGGWSKVLFKSPPKCCHLTKKPKRNQKTHNFHPNSWIWCIKIKFMRLFLKELFSSTRASPMASLANRQADLEKIKYPSLTRGKTFCERFFCAAEKQNYYTQQKRRKRGKRGLLPVEPKIWLWSYWKTMEKPQTLWSLDLALIILNL